MRKHLPALLPMSCPRCRYPDGLALFAAADYTAPEECSDLNSHITNACAWNKAAAAGDTSLFGTQSDAMRMLDELPPIISQETRMPLEEAECRIRKVTQDCYKIVGSCFEAVLSEVKFRIE